MPVFGSQRVGGGPGGYRHNRPCRGPNSSSNGQRARSDLLLEGVALAPLDCSLAGLGGLNLLYMQGQGASHQC